MPHLILLVVRTMEIDRIAEFYGCLGIRFAYEGQTGEHRIRAMGLSRQRLVVEVHAVDRPEDVDRTTRLGFAVPDLQTAMSALKSFEAEFVGEPIAGRHGRRVVVKDPDGRLVEVYERRAPLCSLVRFLRRLGSPLTSLGTKLAGTNT